MGSYYSMRCGRFKEMDSVGDTGSRAEAHPSFGASEAKIRRGAAQNNMGFGWFELLAKQCLNNYDVKGDGGFPLR